VDTCRRYGVAPVCGWLAIGAGFLVDAAVGSLIAAAMTLHGFADGMSIVAVFRDAMRQKKPLLLGLLGVVVMAPLFGAVLAFAYPVSPLILLVLMAWLAGFFLFLSLSELLPQAHASARLRSSGLWLTVLGVLLAGVSGWFHHG
jgi:zinc and cadmium transporter